ncbi:ribose/galactose ABC transporter substrate-binding protein [Spiroplasma gladiatoris]|uniref:Ribose/galactose ABC transporter substrate-binding protein n=1 Tax=Spiroplasma gladiatoris TaxID=2143 RepID=A0A4P7AIZ4_9MOLU|nr:hypothetical protein [Spiroplasma gladiatoris]QBQ07748.1 ribose/galactose ABC transporter substrate-binding protein [Spiroplasma gladiatoris]
MKKLLTGLMSISIGVSSATSAVACGGKKQFNDVYLVTDAGRINDKSFNESGKTAGDIFIKDILKVNANDEYSGIGFNEPEDISKIIDGYETAKAAGAKVAILPGFHHDGDNIKKASEILGNDATEIVIDVKNTQKIPTAIGLMYKADMSGFYAGISSIYQSIKDKNYKDNKVKLATFGGQSNYFAVELFMVGFLSAIQVFNELKTTDELASVFKDLDYKNIEASKIDAQKTTPIDGNDKNWYSTSFNSGEGKNISEVIVNQEPNVVMAVAGPQTADLLGVIKAKNKQDSIKVVGVDTNQAEAYASDYSNSFITSAEKNIKDSTVIALGSSKAYHDNETVKANIVNYYKDKNLHMTFDEDDMDIKESLGKDLSGKTLWTEGDLSFGGNNSLSKESADLIKSKFTVDILKDASTNFFSKASTYKASDLLSAIKEYADLVLNKFEK